MRRVIARGLLGMALLALLGDLLFAWKLIPAYQKMQRTGDGAGFSLGLTFLLFLFLPLTLDLALAGLLLDPPIWLRRMRIMRTGACGVALAGAIVPLIAAVGLQVRGLWGAYHLGVLMLEGNRTCRYANPYARHLLELASPPCQLPETAWVHLLNEDRVAARLETGIETRYRTVSLPSDQVVRWWVTPWGDPSTGSAQRLRTPPGPGLFAGCHCPTTGRAGRSLPAQRPLPRTVHPPGHDPDPSGGPAPARHLQRDRSAVPPSAESRGPTDGPAGERHADDYLALTEYLQYLRRLARDEQLRGVYGYFLGSGFNELGSNSLAPERPVTPEWYARVFNGYGEPVAHSDNAVEVIGAENPHVRVLVGPVRPWNADQDGDRRYAIDVPWLNYMNTLVAALDEGARAKSAAGIPLAAPDGFALHVPGRPEAAEAMGREGYEEPWLDLRRAEWDGAQAGFRVYRDWLDIWIIT